METDKLKAYLCRDHFERVIQEKTCSTCPSLAENRKAVEALTKMYADAPEKIDAAVLTELRSIRRLQQATTDDLVNLRQQIVVMQHCLSGDGNGHRGLVSKVLMIEERTKWAAGSTTIWLARGGSILTILIALAALVIAMYHGKP